MIKSLKLRFVLILVFLVLSIIFCLPNIVDLEGAWKKYLPSDKIHLGLDLKGGMQLLLELDTAKLMDNIVERKVNGLKDAMIMEGVRFLGIDKKGTSILVAIRPDQREKLFNVVGTKFSDLKAGTPRTEGDLMHIDFLIPDKDLASIKDNAVNQALETIRNRIDQFGVSEPVIIKQGENQILVQLPGVKDPQRALELIGKTAQLEFKLVDEAATASGGAGPISPDDKRSSRYGRRIGRLA